MPHEVRKRTVYKHKTIHVSQKTSWLKLCVQELNPPAALLRITYHTHIITIIAFSELFFASEATASSLRQLSFARFLTSKNAFQTL